MSSQGTFKDSMSLYKVLGTGPGPHLLWKVEEGHYQSGQKSRKHLD